MSDQLTPAIAVDPEILELCRLPAALGVVADDIGSFDSRYVIEDFFGKTAAKERRLRRKADAAKGLLDRLCADVSAAMDCANANLREADAARRAYAVLSKIYDHVSTTVSGLGTYWEEWPPKQVLEYVTDTFGRLSYYLAPLDDAVGEAHLAAHLGTTTANGNPVCVQSAARVRIGPGHQKLVKALGRAALKGEIVAEKADLEYNYARKLLSELVKWGYLTNDSDGYRRTKTPLPQ